MVHQQGSMQGLVCWRCLSMSDGARLLPSQFSLCLQAGFHVLLKWPRFSWILPYFLSKDVHCTLIIHSQRLTWPPPFLQGALVPQPCSIGDHNLRTLSLNSRGCGAATAILESQASGLRSAFSLHSRAADAGAVQASAGTRRTRAARSCRARRTTVFCTLPMAAT